MNGGVPIDEATDTEQSDWGAVPAEFSYSAEPNTQFVALGANGQIISSTAVPESSSFTLLGLVCLLLGIVRRYQRNDLV